MGRLYAILKVPRKRNQQRLVAVTPAALVALKAIGVIAASTLTPVPMDRYWPVLPPTGLALKKDEDHK
jgi:hypothetical protein